MRVTSVSLYSNESEAISFDLRNVSSQSPYMVRTIVGLDAEEITPRFYGFSKDGTDRFYDFRLKARDIIIRIVLNPRFNLNESISYIRDNLYRVISATRSGKLTLQFISGAATVAKIEGHMIKFEVPYFSKTPELQITIRCNDPMFRGINPVVMTVDDLPTTNPIVVADSISTAPHGFTMRFKINSTLASFTIQDKASNPTWDFKVTPASPFQANDVIYFSSEFTNRYLYMVRGGATTHLLDRIDPSSVQPLIFPGFNEFHFVNLAAMTWEELRFDVAYWGV
jgi:hypothetical protein